MDNLQSVFGELIERSEEWGVYFKPPLSDIVLQEWVARAQATLKFDLPESYLRMLALSNGLETQRGWLYDAESFLQQNYVCWFCDTIGQTGPDGFQIEYVPRSVPRTPEYAWLGAYGNMDQYIFDFASCEYRSTGLGSPDYVWFSTPHLAELLLFMAKPVVEQNL